MMHRNNKPYNSILLRQSLLKNQQIKSQSKMLPTYQQTQAQSRELSQRMRMGTGVSTLLHQPQSQTHYIDALQRFQKDYAHYDKIKRQEQTQKRYRQMEKRKIQMLDREQRRYQLMEDYQRKVKSRQQQNNRLQSSGIRRTANRNGLPYNPINLQYENNPEGQRLKTYDEEQKIRGYVRAHNMDTKGNCRYNLINGAQRLGVDLVVPNDLRQRFQTKKNQHYQYQRIRIAPSSTKEIRYNNIFQ